MPMSKNMALNRLGSEEKPTSTRGAMLSARTTFKNKPK